MTVVEVPQWQGSGSATAERLREGARLLAGMVPAGRRLRVEVDDDLIITASRVRAMMSQVGEGLMVTAGGDCGVELEPVAAARRKYGDRLVIVWFDAHGDLNTLADSPSGAFHGMVLRALTGEGPAGLVPEEPVRPWQIVLAGVRDLDPAEGTFVETSGVCHLGMPDPATLVDAIASAGFDQGRAGFPKERGFEEKVVYLHIDLDVLDPEVFASVGTPAPGGMRPDGLLGLVSAVAERFEVVGLGIVEYEPGRPEDQKLLAPLVEKLVKVCART
ncbi:arginase family protein [Nonomuraea aurantiaca]|uniref:arginase family protein n=1 Tax=Nonomuraea aurantiaca TaxID=2878562 RepID=UPI001CDA42DE|nr:arginase family protein [Nonomuraea aurantiaca]MCA2225728.1 arginase family protein [Nonomuraea aurantiaca]